MSTDNKLSIRFVFKSPYFLSTQWRQTILAYLKGVSGEFWGVFWSRKIWREKVLWMFREFSILVDSDIIDRFLFEFDMDKKYPKNLRHFQWLHFYL